MRVLLLVAAAAFAAPAHSDYLAYAVSDDGRSPLPERINDIAAEHLVNLEWGAYDGRRSRVGVLPVDNTSSVSSFQVSSGAADIDFSTTSAGIPVNGIEAIVIDTMARTGRFRLVERTVLEGVLGEQDLAASGRVAAPSGAATGNVLGAQYLVQVVVTDYESNTKSSKGGGGIGALFRNRIPVIGGVGVKRGQGRVGLNFRLIDAETSEVVYTRQVESIIREAGLLLGGGGLLGDAALGGFFGNYSRTPIGQAVIAGINKGVYELVQQIGTQPAAGSVIKADANRVWINLGADVVAVGERLDVKAVGEELIDPETGISLGSTQTLLGQVEVSQVQEKYSIARPVTLSRTPARGDKVVSTAPAPTIEYASSWQAP